MHPTPHTPVRLPKRREEPPAHPGDQGGEPAVVGVVGPEEQRAVEGEGLSSIRVVFLIGVGWPGVVEPSPIGVVIGGVMRVGGLLNRGFEPSRAISVGRATCCDRELDQ